LSTGLDRALIDWWRATPALNSLVPVDRVASEIKQTDETLTDDDDNDGHFDDCVVFQIASEPHWRTNSTRGWKSVVKLSVFSMDYDKSKAIAQAIESAWDDGTHTATGSTITLSRSTGIIGVQDETTGIWDHTVSFNMNHTGI
jgi:hypothetical protein